MKLNFSILKKHKKLFILVFLIISVISLILYSLNRPEPVTEYTVQKETLINTVSVNGNYFVASQTDVLSPSKGIITDLYVDNDSFVRTGDNLFHVKSTATPEEKSKAYADYLLAKTNLDHAQSTKLALQAEMFSKWDAFKELAEGDNYEKEDGTPKTENRVLPEFHIPEKEWLAAESAYKNQTTVLSQTQAALNTTWLAYKATHDITVTATADGEIANLLKKAGDQVESQTPVLIIANFNNPSVIASVNEVNIPRIKLGQKARIVFDALPAREYTGIVENINQIGIKTQGSVNYDTKIMLTNSDSFIKPGMTAQITIETLKKHNILTIPNRSIITKNNRNYVQKSDRNKTITEVIIGEKGLTKSEILKGLKPGEKIIIPD